MDVKLTLPAFFALVDLAFWDHDTIYEFFDCDDLGDDYQAGLVTRVSSWGRFTVNYTEQVSVNKKTGQVQAEPNPCSGGAYSLEGIVIVDDQGQEIDSNLALIGANDRCAHWAEIININYEHVLMRVKG